MHSLKRICSLTFVQVSGEVRDNRLNSRIRREMMSQEHGQRLDERRSRLMRVHVRLQDEEEFPNGRKFGQSLLQIEPLEF